MTHFRAKSCIIIFDIFSRSNCNKRLYLAKRPSVNSYSNYETINLPNFNSNTSFPSTTKCSKASAIILNLWFVKITNDQRSFSFQFNFPRKYRQIFRDFYPRKQMIKWYLVIFFYYSHKNKKCSTVYLYIRMNWV